MKRYQIIKGDALSLLKTMEDGSFDGIVTDPPYASGGMQTTDRQRPTSEKYTDSNSKRKFLDFPGDMKDQRVWTRWMAEWLSEARRICKPGAPICIFIDWRQLPALTDALQWADWVWRGVAVWHKPNARPQKGRFRQETEFIVWASNGPMPLDRDVPCLRGIFQNANVAINKRHHQTEKPVELMREIVKIVEKDGHILDPFCGSGSTIQAALTEGYRATGIELSDEYFEIARKRIEDYLKGEMKQ